MEEFMKKERLEKLVGDVLSNEIKKLPNFSIVRSYSNEKCKNTNLLRFDYGIFYKRNPILLVEVDEGHHFSYPTNRVGISRSVDNQITQVVKVNELIKWEFQLRSLLPILHITQHDHCNSEVDLQHFFLGKLYIAFFGRNLNPKMKYTLFYKEFFQFFGANRICLCNEKDQEKYRSFVYHYNKGTLNIWIKKNIFINA